MKLIYCLFFIFTIAISNSVSDIHRLVRVSDVEISAPQNTSELCEILKHARKAHKSVSVIGGRHSQGGQAFCQNGIIVDLNGWKKIKSFNQETKKITVEPGLTWKEIQEYINPYGLALPVVQYYDNFTVGGSLAVNAHGPDHICGTIINVVDMLTVMKADGTIVTCSRHENPDLFSSAIGGYGLCGIILDATINLTDNYLFQVQTKVIPIAEYTEYIKTHILSDPAIKLYHSYISVDTKNFLDHALIISYHAKHLKNAQNPLRTFYEPLIGGVFHNLRNFNCLRELNFHLNKFVADFGNPITRNNAMRRETRIKIERRWVNILYEYFIPVENFATFFNEFRTYMAQKRNNKLLGVVIRFIPADRLSALSYAQKDCFSVALFMSRRRNKKIAEEQNKFFFDLNKIALTYKGTFYLVSHIDEMHKNQIKKAYPQLANFIQQKKKFDPTMLFTNNVWSLISNTCDKAECNKF